MVMSMEAHITLERLGDELRDIFKFDHGQQFTLKWLDEEGMDKRPWT